MSEGGIHNSFVLFSSKESREAGKVSIFAIVETLLSGAAIWLLVSWSNYYWLLLTSIVLAFLVLLRSPKSIAQGRDMFTAYWARESALTKAEITAILVLSAVLAGVAAWLLATQWLESRTGWGLLWRSALVSCLAMNIGFAIVVTRVGAGQEAVAIAAAITGAVAATVAVTGAVASAGAGAGAGATAAAAAGAVAIAGAGAIAVAEAGAAAIAVAGAAAAVGAEAVAGATASAKARAAARAKVVVGVGASAGTTSRARAAARARTVAVAGAVAAAAVLGPGFAFGVVFRAVAVRIWATLCHVHKGVPCFAENWTNLAIISDSRTQPELIPGLPEEHPLNFKTALNQFSKTSGLPDSVTHGMILIILYGPSVAYRYYLKSTAWLYFPLIWLAHVPRGFRDVDGKLIWNKSYGRSLLDILFILSSLGVLGYAGYEIFDSGTFQEAKQDVAARDLPITPVLLFASMKFGMLNLWYWIPTLSALFGVSTFLWSNKLQANAEGHADYQPSQRVLWVLLKLNSAKNWLTIAWILIGFYTLVLSLYLNCRLPEAASPWLAPLFGQITCP